MIIIKEGRKTIYKPEPKKSKRAVKKDEPEIKEEKEEKEEEK